MIATPHYGSGEGMDTNGLFGGAIGSVLAVLLVVLALAWIFMPFWIWGIREDIKRHVHQQEKLLRTVESLLHETRQQANRTR